MKPPVSSIHTKSKHHFKDVALEIFRYQAKNVDVYREYLSHLNVLDKVNRINEVEAIPFLPISLFKSHNIVTKGYQPQTIFESSGTTGQQTSKHLVVDEDWYHRVHRFGFSQHYGNIEDYVVLALLPSYLERGQSSLVCMVNDMINATQNADSGFYLNNYEGLATKLHELAEKNQNVLLIGVSYALLDLMEYGPFDLSNTIVMETGGMKGRRKEMVKHELHEILKQGLGAKNIHSEYGMTELLSQAYAKQNGIFETIQTMQVLIRDINDPFSILPNGQSGGINVIDLGNMYSCSFIATQDLGKKFDNATFEVLGRFDNSDVRGCNLMVG